jgi:hypothetical protein
VTEQGGERRLAIRLAMAMFVLVVDTSLDDLRMMRLPDPASPGEEVVVLG